MFKYQILLEYDGSKFVGWQVQRKGASVQKTVEKIQGIQFFDQWF